MARPSDFALLEAYRSGDAAAGDELLRRHYDVVYRFFANKAGDAAEDLVQETFAACVSARPDLQREGGFRAYLLCAARNKLYTWLERRAREFTRIDWDAVSCADIAPSPSSEARRAEHRAVIFDAMRRLPVDLQVTIELFYFEDVRGPELATVLEVPEGTARTRLRRARQRLRDELEAVGFEPSQASFERRGPDDLVASLRRDLVRHKPG